LIKILIADEIDLSGTSYISNKKFFLDCKFGIKNSDIVKSFNDFEVLVIRSIRKIDKNFLDKTSFKVIATCSKGTDHIDTDYAAKKGISILNADDSNNISAAEHTFALILSIFKRINLSDKLVRENKFSFIDFERNELYGKSIGIIGYGKVGSYVGKLSEAFCMKVYANDIDKKVAEDNKNINFKSVNYIFKTCDIVSIHIPLNKKNYHFVSMEKLNMLNKNSVFINTSRGDVVEEKYLFSLLKNKKIKFAGLDVFSNEPSVFKGFAELENVLLTNHIAGKTIESRKNISENIFKSIKNFYL
jgi:phosphoglycerate dehydrogenase-like enzyme